MHMLSMRGQRKCTYCGKALLSQEDTIILYNGRPLCVDCYKRQHMAEVFA